MAKIILIETSTDLCSVAISDNDRIISHRESSTPRAHASLTAAFVQESLDELKRIFDVTGGTERIETVEKYSREKAREMGMDMDEYFRETFEHSSPGHLNGED